METTPSTKNSARRGRSYAEVVSQAQVMTAGLKNNAAEVAKRGIDADFVTRLQNNRSAAIAMNDEQEKLKADLKVKTEALNAKVKEITDQLAEARKVVKLSIPKAQWKEFGIEDKR